MIDSDYLFIMTALDKKLLNNVDFNKVVIFKIDLSSINIPYLNRIRINISNNLKNKCYIGMLNCLCINMMHGEFSGGRMQWIK